MKNYFQDPNCFCLKKPKFAERIGTLPPSNVHFWQLVGYPRQNNSFVVELLQSVRNSETEYQNQPMNDRKINDATVVTDWLGSLQHLLQAKMTCQCITTNGLEFAKFIIE